MHTPHPFQREIPGWMLNPAEAWRTAAISLPAPVRWRHLWDPPLWWPETLPDSRQLLGRGEAVQWHQRAHTHLGQGHQMGRPRGPGRVTH